MSTIITVNAINNHSFESGLNDWIKCNNNTTTITVQNSGGIDNGKCVRISVAADGAENGILQSKFLSPGTYTVTFFAKKISGNADFWVSIFGQEASTSASYASQLDSDYAELSYTFTITGNFRKLCNVYFKAGSAEGVILLDKITLMAPLRDTFSLQYADVYLTSALQSGLNVRAAMNNNAEVIAYWPHGRRALVLPTSNSEWFECRYCGQVGYIRAEYLRNFTPANDCNSFESDLDTAYRLEEVAVQEVSAATYGNPKFYKTTAEVDQEWCHMFVDWLSGHCYWGINPGSRFPNLANCRKGVRWFFDHAEFFFINASYKAKVRTFSDFSDVITSDALTNAEQNAWMLDGDYVYFTSSKPTEVARHVAIVIYSRPTSITIAEGNMDKTTNGVIIRTIAKSNYEDEGIFGFGRPQGYSRG